LPFQYASIGRERELFVALGGCQGADA